MKFECPLCHKAFEAPAKHETRPFCSPRCKKMDLANWLEGNYCLPRDLSPEDLADLPEDKQEELLAAALGGTVDKEFLN